MNHSILLKLRGDSEYIRLRTVTHEDNGRRSTLYAARSDLLRLERESEVIIKDCSEFAVLRRDPYRKMVTISLYWLREYDDQTLNGKKQQLRLPYDQFRDYLMSCTEKNVTIEKRMLSLPENRRPRIVFMEKGNLHKAVSNKQIRKKLSKFLRNAFLWSGATEIRMYNDFVPYSFYFRELRGDTVGIEGGVILHGLDNPKTASYSIHT